MQIYLHTAGHEDPDLIEVEPTVLVSEVLVGIDGDALWIEEVDVEIDGALTLEAAGIIHKGHVYVGHCKKVHVRVRYGGVTLERDFSPSARIRKVWAWATGPDGFGLSATEAAKHVLELPASDHRVPDRTHVGSIASDCELVLDLEPKIRHEG